jgi:hypothetical protein
MTPRRDWFQVQGFTIVHTPGISRAWRFDFSDGGCLLVTDVGGFDLPEPGGPYSATCLSRREELVEFVPLLRRTKDLHRYFRRWQRTFQNHAGHSHTSSNHSKGSDT